MSNVITMELNGYKGQAIVQWVEDMWNAPHYEAFITVPFKDSRWEHLFVGDKADIDGAQSKAKEYLTMALERCTLF